MATYIRSAQVVSRQVAGEPVLVPRNARSLTPHEKAADLFTLNASGALLWERLQTPQDEQALVQRLVDSYALPTDQAQTDVRAFIADLVSIGAIERKES